MQNILLSYLSKQDMDVHPDVLDWKDFETRYKELDKLLSIK